MHKKHCVITSSVTRWLCILTMNPKTYLLNPSSSQLCMISKSWILKPSKWFTFQTPLMDLTQKSLVWRWTNPLKMILKPMSFTSSGRATIGVGGHVPPLKIPKINIFVGFEKNPSRSITWKEFFNWSCKKICSIW